MGSFIGISKKNMKIKDFHIFPLGASGNYAFSIGFVSEMDMPGSGWPESKKIMNFCDFVFFAEILKEAHM